VSWNRTCSRESPEEHYAPRDRHGDTRGRQRRSTRAHQSLLRAVKLDTRLYHEVGADTTATTQAISVVVLVALASGIMLNAMMMKVCAVDWEMLRSR